jgi:hypothetical protein
MALTTNLQQTAPPHSVTVQGAYEPFELQVARNQIMGHTSLCNFGFNSAVGTSYETVWIEGGTYAFPTDSAILKVSSSSATDDKDSTGAHTVLIEGLNENGNLVSEIVTLEGQTQVDTINEYFRVNKMIVLTAGSGGTSVGAIYAGTGSAGGGLPTVIFNRTGINSNESESAFYTVPIGYTAYINAWTMSSANTAADTSTQFILRIRPIDGVFGVKALYGVPGNGIYECNAAYPFAAPELSDIEIRAAANSGTAVASSQLQIVLIKNDSQTV